MSQPSELLEAIADTPIVTKTTDATTVNSPIVSETLDFSMSEIVVVAA